MRIAFAGSGYIASIHARAAQAQPGVQLAAVVARPSERSENFARTFGIPQRYETVEQLLAAGTADALVIGTPNHLHAPQAIAALRAGLPVLVEKPMAMNAQEAERMCEAAQASGAALMVAHCWRFDREALWLKEHAAALGDIVRTRGSGVHTHWGPDGWFTKKALAGGGALVDMGIHAIDTTRFLLGDPQPANVYAKIGTYYTDHEVDDTGVILIEWENGVTSIIESGWWQPHSDGPEAVTQLYGTRGFGRLFPTRLEIPDPANGKVDLVDPGYAFPRDEHCQPGMYEAQMAYFIDCIRTGRAPHPGGAEGLANMKIVDAAYESARTGQIVETR